MGHVEVSQKFQTWRHDHDERKQGSVASHCTLTFFQTVLPRRFSSVKTKRQNTEGQYYGLKPLQPSPRGITMHSRVAAACPTSHWHRGSTTVPSRTLLKPSINQNVWNQWNSIFMRTRCFSRAIAKSNTTTTRMIRCNHGSFFHI